MFKKSEKEKKSKNFETKKKVEKFFGGNILFFGGNFLFFGENFLEMENGECCVMCHNCHTIKGFVKGESCGGGGGSIALSRRIEFYDNYNLV